MTLPGIFSTDLNSIPSHFPYLQAKAKIAHSWKSRIAALPQGLNVGLARAGSSTHKLDRFRSIPPHDLRPLMQTRDVNWISLQKNAAATTSEFPITDWTTDLHDFADTAALIDNLDLVISVDTSVAHLAGAMGKKTWILLAHPPDWRWMLDRRDSPWYPSARLFRQKTRGDWTSAIAAVAQSLQNEPPRIS
jgi:hypothetical protein